MKSVRQRLQSLLEKYGIGIETKPAHIAVANCGQSAADVERQQNPREIDGRPAR